MQVPLHQTDILHFRRCDVVGTRRRRRRRLIIAKFTTFLQKKCFVRYEAESCCLQLTFASENVN